MLLTTACKNKPGTPTKPVDYFSAMHITDSLRNTKNSAATLHFIDSLYASQPSLTVKEQYEQYDLKRSYYYEGQHNYFMASLYADSMLAVLNGKENDRAYAKDYGNAYQVKGDALLALKKYNEAFQYYYMGELLVARIGDGNFNSGYSARLGINCYQQGKFKEAASYFKMAYRQRLPYVPKNQDERYQQLAIEQEMLDDVGLCYSKINMADSALFYFNKTQAAISLLGEKAATPKKNLFAQIAKGVVYGNTGDVYFASGDKKIAESLWKQSIAINSQKGHDNHDAWLTRIKLANLYLTDNNPAAALALLKQVEATQNIASDAGSRLRFLKLKWDYFDKTKNIAHAYAGMRNYQNLKDSIAATAKEDQSADMGVTFKVLEAQHANELLKKSNSLKESYLFIAVLAAAAACFIAFLVAQNGRRSKRNVILLTRLNKNIITHNQQMEQTVNVLEQSQEDNARMMKIVAHDLRNPVGNMTSIAAMLLEQAGADDSQKELLELLKASGTTSLNLISTLLNSSSGIENMAKEPVDLYTLLNYCVEVMQFKAREKQQEIQLQAEHITIAINRERMWRVISNLVANAIKFSPEHTIISIGTQEQPGKIIVMVKDEGMGIPVELHDKVFDMFTTSRRKGTAGEEPFGMGLAIAKQIVEAHEGKIWFESKPDAGTTFYVELPV